MTPPLSRRTLVRGAAWSAPVIAASAAVPAYAASYCTNDNKLAIDNAFTQVATKALTAYWTEPSAGLLDGISKVPSFNILNNSQFDISLSNTNGLQIKFQAVYKKFHSNLFARWAYFCQHLVGEHFRSNHFNGGKAAGTYLDMERKWYQLGR